MTRFSKLPLLICVAIMTPPSSTSAQEAGLDETLSWLAGHFASPVYDRGEHRDRKLVRNGRCGVVLSYTQIVSIPGVTPWSLRNKWVTSLSELSPDVQVNNNSRIIVETASGQAKIAQAIVHDRGEVSSSMLNRLIIVFGNSMAAERAAKAFSHAITLCGGKAPPF